MTEFEDSLKEIVLRVPNVVSSTLELELESSSGADIDVYRCYVDIRPDMELFVRVEVTKLDLYIYMEITEINPDTFRTGNFLDARFYTSSLFSLRRKILDLIEEFSKIERAVDWKTEGF